MNMTPPRQERPEPRPAPRRAPARNADRRGAPWLAIAGYGALGVACLLLAVVTFLIVAAPVDHIREQVAERVKARTGRTLSVAGPASVSIFPRPSVSLADVTLSAPPGMEGQPTLAMQGLDVEIGLWSLLTGRVSADRVSVHRPVIDLRVDVQGRRNWSFADDAPRPASAPTPPGDARKSPRASTIERLGLSQVRVVDGRVRYRDERTGRSQEFEQVDLLVAMDDPANPLVAKGSLVWNGEKLVFDAALAPLRALLDDQPARLSLKVAGKPFDANYEGSFSLAGGLALDGKLDARAASAEALRGWTGGSALAPPLSVSSLLKLAEGQLSLSSLEASLGEATLSGALAIETKGERPYLRGSVQLTELDFGNLLIREPRAKTQSAPAEPAPAGKAVRGSARRTGGEAWSEETIDLALLGRADADLDLSVGRLVYKDVTTSRSRLTLALRDKVASIRLEDVSLYEGRARGLLSLDGSGPVLVAGADLALDGVSSQPLLKDALRFGWLAGRGSFKLAVAGQGLSEREIIETLNGKVDLAIAHGAVLGVDVAKVLGTLEQGRLPRIEISEAEKTSFSELAGAFVITGGTAQNNDLRLVSPHIRVTGAGSINLAARQLDYTVRPKIVGADAPRPGTVVSLSGLELPVRIEGPWEKPTFTPDLKDLVKDPSQAAEAIKQIGKNLKSPEVQDAIRGLLQPGEGEQRVKPRDLLDKLLKKQ